MRLRTLAASLLLVMGVGEGDAQYLRGIQEALNAMIAEQAVANAATYGDVYGPSEGKTACDLPVVRWASRWCRCTPPPPSTPTSGGWWAWLRSSPPPSDSLPPMCDCLVALAPRSASSATLFAKNSDRPPGEAQRVEWHPPRRDRRPIHVTHIEVAPHPTETIGTLISRPWWMWGAEHGVNEAGVAIGNETIYTRLDPRGFPPALTGMDLVRLALERAATAGEAVETIAGLIDRYGQGGSGHHGADRPYWSSFLVADPDGAWVVETSGRDVATEPVRATRAISNRTTIPAFDAVHRHPRQPVERLVDPRLAASNAVLANEEPIAVDDLKAHLRSHVGGDGGWTVCMHVPDVEATTASLIVELPDPDGTARPLARVLLGSPCASVYVPLFVGRSLGTPVEWDRFAALDANDREPLDELEQSLEADVTDDDGWADEAWSRVARLLDS